MKKSEAIRVLEEMFTVCEGRIIEVALRGTSTYKVNLGKEYLYTEALTEAIKLLKPTKERK